MICDCVFGLESNAFLENSEFLDGANKMFETKILDFPHKSIMTVFPFLEKMFPYRLFAEKDTNWFTEFTKFAIETRKSNGIIRDDCLNYLINLQEKKGLSTVDVAAIAFVLFIDGFETSSTILANVLYQLAQNEKCQQKLRDELNNFEAISFDNLDQMQYLDNVLNGMSIKRFTFKYLTSNV